MKFSAMCVVIIFGLGLSACGHFGKKCCGQSSCSLENKEQCHKDAKECSHSECEMKK